jgi:predicted ArsR family transcriptional regulator
METREERALDQVHHLEVALDRDGFVRTLLRHLAGTLEEVIGLQDASGFISVVGQRMGDEIGAAYRAALQVPRLSREEVAAVMVDLKRRIQGDFYVIEQSDEQIVLGNRACPFGDKVLGRPSLCMMTSNVFGVIAAENLGYSRVVLERTIAEGHPGCRIVVHLKPGPETTSGREYLRGS